MSRSFLVVSSENLPAETADGRIGAAERRQQLDVPPGSVAITEPLPQHLPDQAAAPARRPRTAGRPARQRRCTELSPAGKSASPSASVQPAPKSCRPDDSVAGSSHAVDVEHRQRDLHRRSTLPLTVRRSRATAPGRVPSLKVVRDDAGPALLSACTGAPTSGPGASPPSDVAPDRSASRRLPLAGRRRRTSPAARWCRPGPPPSPAAARAAADERGQERRQPPSRRPRDVGRAERGREGGVADLQRAARPGGVEPDHAVAQVDESGRPEDPSEIWSPMTLPFSVTRSRHSTSSVPSL